MPSFLMTFLFCTICMFPSKQQDHPIYITFAEIDYKAERKALEISIKLFADDMEAMFSKQEGRRIEIGTDYEDPEVNQLLEDYLKQHFRIFADSEKVTYNYLGKEMGGKQNIFEMYVFIEATAIEAFNELEIQNSILIEEHYNQLNFAACKTTKGLKKVVSKKGDLRQKVKW